MKKVLVLGSNGFIGSNIIDYIIKRKISYFGADSNKGRNKNTIYVDITSFNNVFLLIDRLRPGIIINAAGVFKAEMPQAFYQVNCYGSINIFESVFKIKGYNPKIFVIGSAAEYGFVKPSALPVKESFPLKPVGHYGISKAAQTYNALEYYKMGLNIYIGRPFNVIGPGRSDHLALSSFARQIAEIKAGKKKPCIYAGNLKAKRDFIDIIDLTDAIWKIITKGRKGKVYNICSGRYYPIGDLLEKMICLSKMKVTVKIDPSRVKAVDIPVIYGDYNRLQRDTGWRPTVPIDESIKSMLDYWERNLYAK